MSADRRAEAVEHAVRSVALAEMTPRERLRAAPQTRREEMLAGDGAL